MAGYFLLWVFLLKWVLNSHTQASFTFPESNALMHYFL